MSDNKYEKQVELLAGLGLSSLKVTRKQLRRLKRYNERRYDKVSSLLDDMSVRISKQTPPNHLFICDRNGDFESVFDQAEVVFTVAPLDLKEIATLWTQNIALADVGDLSANEKLYQVIKQGYLPLVNDPASMPKETKLKCSHMVYLENKKRTAYYVGSNEQTALLEKALAPFINVTHRSRTKSDDSLIASNTQLLADSRSKLQRLLSRTEKKETVKKSKKEKKPKKAKKLAKEAVQPVVEDFNAGELVQMPVAEKDEEEKTKKRTNDEADLDLVAEENMMVEKKRAKKSPRFSVPLLPVAHDSQETEGHSIEEELAKLDALEPLAYHDATAVDYDQWSLLVNEMSVITPVG